jgi:hypothetical protein
MGRRDGFGSFSGKVAPRRAGTRQNLRNYSLKFTGKVVGDPLVLQDNARYEGTAEKPSFWVLKRVRRGWAGVTYLKKLSPKFKMHLLVIPAICQLKLTAELL